MNLKKHLIPLGALSLALLWSSPIDAQVRVVNNVLEESIQSEKTNFKLVKVVEGLENPWAIAWLPDGRMLITERPGRLHLIDGNNVTELKNLPQIDVEEDMKSADDGGNQGGLLDVVVHPDYIDNGWIYFTYSSPGDDDTNFSGDEEYTTGTALARAKLADDGSDLEELETLYTESPRTAPGRHYGSRIVFPGDGNVIFSIGDRGIRYPSQDLTDPAGSMIRLKEDGGATLDNPFVNVAPGNLRPEIYSFGHRNNQAMAIHPTTGELWTAEHGPDGGDLLHKVEKGNNYGWPQVAFAPEYDTTEPIGIGEEAPGVTKPIHVWRDNIAPSGMAFYFGGQINGWDGSMFVGSLVKEQLHRLTLDGDEVTDEEILLKEKIGRIRDVRQGPDGFLYIATDEKEDGAVYRLEPAN
jgi:aldose sugar dehydrogenase